MAFRKLFAWLVHFYTACGILIGFFAFHYIDQGNYRGAFWLMALAMVIDCTDGSLARFARVKEIVPKIDGDRLDNIVDYLNYVLVPSFFLFRGDLLPPEDKWWLSLLPLLASAYGFSQKEAKTEDHFFLGFPSYWNVVVFYFYVLATPHWVNGFFIIGTSVLVFVPIRYLYPSRSPVLRGPTVIFGFLWAVSLLLLIFQIPSVSKALAMASLLYPIYYFGLSFWLEIKRML